MTGRSGATSGFGPVAPRAGSEGSTLRVVSLNPDLLEGLDLLGEEGRMVRTLRERVARSETLERTPERLENLPTREA